MKKFIKFFSLLFTAFYLNASTTLNIKVDDSEKTQNYWVELTKAKGRSYGSGPYRVSYIDKRTNVVGNNPNGYPCPRPGTNSISLEVEPDDQLEITTYKYYFPQAKRFILVKCKVKDLEGNTITLKDTQANTN